MKRREFIMVLGGRGGYVLPSTARGVRAAAGAVGLTLPITLLGRADEVIE
jgi:hypothetical protein